MVYDGTCKVCTRLANLLRKWDRPHTLRGGLVADAGRHGAISVDSAARVRGGAADGGAGWDDLERRRGN